MIQSGYLSCDWLCCGNTAALQDDNASCVVLCRLTDGKLGLAPLVYNMGRYPLDATHSVLTLRPTANNVSF